MATKVFAFTGDVERWRVPAGVKIIEVVVEGAASNDRQGGRVAGRMRVEPGKDLFVTVGRQGRAPDGKEGGEPVFGGGGRGGTGTGPQRTGGWSGGGGSWIRYGALNGPVRVAAGGAGGTSGDGGQGGRGGHNEDPKQGELGFNAPTGGDAETGRATGGTQNQGGRGGTTKEGTGFRGADAEQVRLGRGGRGGQFPERQNIYGGGGGGGGFYGGGGGQAGIHGISRGGGGAGGSNYTDGIFNSTSVRGAGPAVDNGRVTITWDPAGGDNPPTSPDDLKINGVPISDQLATRSTGSVVVSGFPNDPDRAEQVRLYVKYSENSNFANHGFKRGDYDLQTQRDRATISGLKQNTLYYLRIHTQEQKPEKLSVNYTSTSFWTNRSPNPPALTSPNENTQITEVTNVTFTWNHNDPDGGPDNTQSAYEFQYRPSGTPTKPATDVWKSVTQVTTAETRTFPAGTFTANTNWDWRVKTRDQQNKWGEFSPLRSFYIIGVNVPPTPTNPTKDEAVRVARPTIFSWKFRTTQAAAAQKRADIRYRVVGTTVWVNVFGDEIIPGNERTWEFEPFTFEPGFNYEWQVRTYDATLTASEWSDTETFWGSYEPGYLSGDEPIDSGRPSSPLGEGTNRVFVYDRGGSKLRGEIKGARLIRWTRVRDDISNLTVYIDEPDEETRALLNGTGTRSTADWSGVHTWRHELVVFRTDADGRTERVWEGPVVRKASSRRAIEIEAKDVMAYAYRRIMRQGYSDSFQVINGEQTGRKTIIQRAVQILLNGLVYDDPNVIGHITPFVNAGDARTGRTRADYSRMVWEEIDDLAAVAGLDYTTIGRRIVFIDTHNAIGKLPEMTDKDFSDPPVITEYGMSAANYFAVTNGTGVWGAVLADGITAPGPEGWIEQLASSYGEDQKPGSDRDLSIEQLATLRRGFREQARRNIANRYPIPVLVRVPDNSRLSPDLQININHLVPGVWLPLRADNGMDSISQWQKLDSITCESTSEGEKITAVMSPAPTNSGEDPDADAVVEEA